MKRCSWVPPDKPLYLSYHDGEWGRPSHDGRHLFEMLCLEGAQAGLSWWTVLRKRADYRRLFHNFEPEAVAAMTDRRLEEILRDPRIIRHRGKVSAIRQNARAWLALAEREGDVVEWLWSFVDGRPQMLRPRSASELPAFSAESGKLSSELKRAGFSFVGPVIIHSFMQAVGMKDEHEAGCFLACRK